jgi:ankyrin repeat protein
VRTIKAIFLAMLLLTANAAMATDEDDMEFRGAVAAGDLPVVKKYIESGAMKVNDVYLGWTPVLAAAAKAQLPMVKYLVEKGGDLNYRHAITKLTPLMYAVLENNLEMAEYLLQKGADPHMNMKGDVSMVRAARDEGYTQMMELLMKNGAKDDGCQEVKCF